jgi:hypothetical protein
LARARYLHARTGSAVNFYFAGYEGFPSADTFSDEAFVRAVTELEQATHWKYSGDTSLLIHNAVFDPNTNETRLDFSSVISVALEGAMTEKSLSSIGQLCEEIVRFAETCSDGDPTWGFSNHQGARIVGSVLKHVVMKLLPKAVQEDANRALHFAVVDVSRDRQISNR